MPAAPRPAPTAPRLTVACAKPFHGAGGWGEAARVLGVRLEGIGLDIHRDVVATANAAGHSCVLGDIRTFDTAVWHDATALIGSAPCPSFTRAGKMLGFKGNGGHAHQLLLDAIDHVGSAHHQWDEELGDYVPGCGCGWGEIERELEPLADPRAGLFVQQIRLALQLPHLEYIALENVATTLPLFEDLAVELFAQWESVEVFRLNAVDYGSAARRDRAYLLASRYGQLASPYPCHRHPIPRTSLAAALGWEPGHHVNTRGNRTTAGGNLFRADGPATCVTGNGARGWYRVADGQRLSAAQAGLIVGFDEHYPWAGSRSSRIQRVADTVAPTVGAAVLGALFDLDWREPLGRHLAHLYPSVHDAPGTRICPGRCR